MPDRHAITQTTLDWYVRESELPAEEVIVRLAAEWGCDPDEVFVAPFPDEPFHFIGSWNDFGTSTEETKCHECSKPIYVEVGLPDHAIPVCDACAFELQHGKR